MRRFLCVSVCLLAWCCTTGVAQEPPLPPGALKRLGSSRLRHGTRVLCVRYSPDGKFLASGGGNDPVRIWDAATGVQVKELKDPWVTSLSFSSRGTRLITANAFKTVREWDLANNAEVAQLKGHESAVTCMIVSSDNTLLASADQNGGIILWELFLSPRQLKRFSGHTAEVTALAFSASCKVLASASSDRSIRLWNVETGGAIKVLDGGCCVSALLFLADGSLASAGDDHQIRIWDTTSGKQVGRWTGHQDVITALLLMPDGKTVISGARDKTMRLWDAEGKQLKAIERTWGDSDALALSPDGKTVVCAGVNNTLRRWDVASGTEFDAGPGHRSPITSMALAPDGKTLASAGSAGDVRLWDLARTAELRSWQDPSPGEVLLAYAPDGETLAAATEADGVRLWNPHADRPAKRIGKVAGDPVLCLAFAPGSKSLALGHRSGRVRLWEAAQGKTLSEFDYGGPVRALAYSLDGAILAASGGKDVTLWDASSGKQLRQFGPKETALLPAVACLAFSPDGKMLATGSFDSVIRLWDIDSGQLLRAVEGHTSAVQSLAFSIDGRRIVSGGFDGTVRLWEAHGGQMVTLWRGHRGAVTSVAFGVDGRSLLSGGADTSILIWDVTGRSANGVLPARKLTVADLHAGWQTLASQDAALANPIIWDMVAGAADSLPFLERSVFLLDPQKLVKLIGDLDSPTYVVREKASMELANYGRWIEPTLEARAREPGSEEMRRRISRLLDKLRETGALTPEQEVLRFRRALLVLEQDGSQAAQNLLRKITTNGPQAYLQAEARATLQRLKGRQ